MQKLILAYEEPHRKYHTLQHLRECLALLSEHAYLAREPAEVEMSIWFHDAIYDVRSQDNEARSAAWVAEVLSCAGVPPERVARIQELILATRHVTIPQGQEQQLLVDIDLAILGADRPRFDEYEDQIRAEYAWVPDPAFRMKRLEILEGFLARTAIYNTAPLCKVLERQARENLAYSVQRLRSGA